jgi:hypothetical protein
MRDTAFWRDLLETGKPWQEVNAVMIPIMREALVAMKEDYITNAEMARRLWPDCPKRPRPLAWTKLFHVLKNLAAHELQHDRAYDEPKPGTGPMRGKTITKAVIWLSARPD